MANLTKDQRIIRDNPGLNAYELLQKGLSEKAYQELLQKEDKAASKVVIEETVDEVLARAEAAKLSLAPETFQDIVETPPPPPPVVSQRAKATVQESHIAVPKLAKAPVVQPPTGMAWLINKATGKRTYMTLYSAERRLKSHPSTYTIQK